MPVMSLAVKTTGNPLSLAKLVPRQVLSVDQGQPASSLMTLDQRLANTLAVRRSHLLVLGIFALLAVGLAAVGIYGLVSYSVTQRTHEIGVRMALGASRQAVLGLVLRQGMVLAGVGVTVGLLGGMGLTRIIASQLYGVPPTDPLTFGGVAFVLLSVAMLAGWLPARRATATDPLLALRYE